MSHRTHIILPRSQIPSSQCVYYRTGLQVYTCVLVVVRFLFRNPLNRALAHVFEFKSRAACICSGSLCILPYICTRCTCLIRYICMYCMLYYALVCDDSRSGTIDFTKVASIRCSVRARACVLAHPAIDWKLLLLLFSPSLPTSRRTYTYILANASAAYNKHERSLLPFCVLSTRSDSGVIA